MLMLHLHQNSLRRDSSASADGTSRPPILNSDNHDAILGFDEHINKQQPPPGTKEKAEAFPPSAQGWSYQREALQDAQRVDDPLAGVGGQAVRADEPVEVFNGDAREFDASHGLQLIQRDGLPGLRLPEPELCALVRSGDAIQQLGDVTRVRVGVVERT